MVIQVCLIVMRPIMHTENYSMNAWKTFMFKIKYEEIYDVEYTLRKIHHLMSKTITTKSRVQIFATLLNAKYYPNLGGNIPSLPTQMIKVNNPNTCFVGK